MAEPQKTEEELFEERLRQKYNAYLEARRKSVKPLCDLAKVVNDAVIYGKHGSRMELTEQVTGLDYHEARRLVRTAQPVNYWGFDAEKLPVHEQPLRRIDQFCHKEGGYEKVKEHIEAGEIGPGSKDRQINNLMRAFLGQKTVEEEQNERKKAVQNSGDNAEKHSEGETDEYSTEPLLLELVLENALQDEIEELDTALYGYMAENDFDTPVEAMMHLLESWEDRNGTE